MPTPEIERLDKTAGKPQVNAAVSACIAREVRGGMPQEQAVAACHEMARGKTGGKPAAPKEGS